MPRRRRVPAVEQVILNEAEQQAHNDIAAAEDRIIFENLVGREDANVADEAVILGIDYGVNINAAHNIFYEQVNNVFIDPQPPIQEMPLLADEPALHYMDQGLRAPAGQIAYDHDAIRFYKEFSSKTKKPKEPMRFGQLDACMRVAYVKREFTSLMKELFERPEKLKELASQNKISNKEAKLLFKAINSLNHNKCTCCRTYDNSKLQMSPVATEFELLLDIALTNAKIRTY